MTTENEIISYDEIPMIRRAMKNIRKSDAHPWAKNLCIEILTGTYKNQRRRLAIQVGILEKERKDINTERSKKGLNRIQWGPNIYETQKDPERHCVVCGESYSDEVLHYYMDCPAIRLIVEVYMKIIEDSFMNNNRKIYDFERAILNTDTKPNDKVRLVIFHDYPAAIRNKSDDELKRLTNVLIMIKGIVNDNIKNKVFRPLMNETLDQLERKIFFLERMRDRSTLRKYMDLMRVYITEKNERQYVQRGPVARRLRTTTNLEIVKIRKHQAK